MSPIEEEIIILHAVNEMIEGMVNRRLLRILDNGMDCEVIPKSSETQDLFYILLVDLLSVAGKEVLSIGPLPYLEHLNNVCENPNFDVNESVRHLRSALSDFRNWLSESFTAKFYCSSLDQDFLLQIQRCFCIHRNGNFSKHNILRYGTDLNRIKAWLNSTGYDQLTEDQILLLAPDLYQRFDGFLKYHIGTIAEFLNNIRCGIHEYLMPEFNRSYTDLLENKYEYQYPKHVTSDYAKKCYWDLMNNLRSGPSIQRLIIGNHLKQRY